MITQDRLELLLTTIRKTGDVGLALIAIDLSWQSYFKLLKDSEINGLVEEAKLDYKKFIIDDWGIVAVKFTDNLLRGKVKKTTVTKSYYLQKNEDGSLSDMVETYRQEKIEDVLPPKWLLDKYLPGENKEQITVDVNFSQVDLSEDDPEAKTLD